MRKTKNHFKKILLLPIFGLGFFAFSGEARAATRLVEVDGVSSGECTVTACDIEYAINTKAGNGDTVSIAAGIYNIRGLAPASGVTVTGVNKDAVIIDGGRNFTATTWNDAEDPDCYGYTDGAYVDSNTMKCEAGVYEYDTTIAAEVSMVYVFKDGAWKHLYKIGKPPCPVYGGCSGNFSVSASGASGGWYSYLNMPPNQIIYNTAGYAPYFKVNPWDVVGGLFFWHPIQQKVYVSFQYDNDPSLETMKYSLEGDYCFDLNSKTGVTIKNLTIQNCERLIELFGSDQNEISNNIFHNGNTKIKVEGQSSYNTIIHNTFEPEDLSPYDSGAIIGNDIYFGSSPTAAPTGNTCDYQTNIYGNWITNEYGYRMCPDPQWNKACATTGSTKVIQCNDDSDCAGGVKCVERNSHIKQAKYTFTKALADDKGSLSSSGIYLLNGQSNKIFRNTFKDCSYTINIATGYGHEIAGNTIYNTHGNSIAIGSASISNIAVHDNLFYNNHQSIRLYLISRVTGIKIYNNRFYNPVWAGASVNPTGHDSGPNFYFYNNSFAGGAVAFNSFYNNGNFGDAVYWVNNIFSSQNVTFQNANFALTAKNALWGRNANNQTSSSFTNNAYADLTSMADFESGETLFWPLANTIATDDLPNWYKGWTDSRTAHTGANIANYNWQLGFSSGYDAGLGATVGWTGHAPAPVLSSATAMSNGITLDWSSHGLISSLRPGRTVEDWVILRKLSTDTEYRAIAELVTGTTYADRSTEDGKTYNYMIHAVYGDGSVSLPSNAKTAVSQGGSNPADVNGDGRVNIKDIQACIKVITGTDTRYQNQCKVLAAPETTTNIKDIQEIIRKVINP